MLRKDVIKLALTNIIAEKLPDVDDLKTITQLISRIYGSCHYEYATCKYYYGRRLELDRSYELAGLQYRTALNICQTLHNKYKQDLITLRIQEIKVRLIEITHSTNSLLLPEQRSNDLHDDKSIDKLDVQE